MPAGQHESETLLSIKMANMSNLGIHFFSSFIPNRADS